MDTEEFKKFLIEGKKHGYALENVKTIRESDGSRSIFYERGGWKSHDNYFGGEPFGGREVIFFQGKPVWMIVFYGYIHNTILTPDEVYSFLRRALRQASEDNLFRGPENFSEGTLTYRNTYTGSIENFEGTETIYGSEKEIYRGRYLGGLVDQGVGE